MDAEGTRAWASLPQGRSRLQFVGCSAIIIGWIRINAENLYSCLQTREIHGTLPDGR